MLKPGATKIALSVLLAVFFAAVSAGAFMEGRWQAVPLGLIFAALAIESSFKAIRGMRSDASENQ